MIDGDDGPVLDDPGLARERTHLAWTRSALSLLTIAALIVREIVLGGEPFLGWPLAAVALALAGTVLWNAHETYGVPTTTASPPRLLAVIGTLTTLLALGSLGLAVTAGS